MFGLSDRPQTSDRALALMGWRDPECMEGCKHISKSLQIVAVESNLPDKHDEKEGFEQNH